MTSHRMSGPALLAGAAMLTACASVPDLGAPPIAQSPAQIAAGRDPGTHFSGQPRSGWWSSYGDPQLDRLIDAALADAPDLPAAAARLAIAKGYAQQIGAALAPDIELGGKAGLTQQSEKNGVPPQFVPGGWKDDGEVRLGFSLDLDLWGANRAALAGARADADAARFEVEQARLVLTTNVASAYAELAALHARRDLIEATIANRAAALRLVADRVESGLDNQAALRQAGSRVPAARAELAAIDEAIKLSRNMLAALIGAGPRRASTIGRPSIMLRRAQEASAQGSIDLVGRRPDIAAARAAVEASSARVDAARRAFYPNVSLNGMIGLQSLGLDNLASGGALFGNVGPAISLPVFRGGALSGQYRGARGRYDEAVARYHGAVLRALREVADVMTSRAMLAERLAHARAAQAGAEAAQALALQRYRLGLANYLDVLVTEEAALDARRAVTDLESRAFTLDVAMVRALGGGITAA